MAGQRVNRNVTAYMRIGEEGDPFSAHLVEAAIKDLLLEFEVWNAIAEKPPDAVVFLVDGNGVAGSTELLRSGETCGSAADYCDTLARVVLRRLRLDPSFIPGALDDAAFDNLDRDSGSVDAEHTGRFAGSRADAARKLGEVVRRMKAANRALPTAVVSKVVPVRNQGVDRTAGMTERNAAIHAAGALFALLFFGDRLVDLEPVLDALFDGPARRLFAVDFEESCDFTHAAPRLLPPLEARE